MKSQTLINVAQRNDIKTYCELSVILVFAGSLFLVRICACDTVARFVFHRGSKTSNRTGEKSGELLGTVTSQCSLHFGVA